MIIGINGTLPAALWNPPPPSIQAVRHLLIKEIDKELARLPIQQQTVFVAVRWDVDGWLVHSFEEAPPSEPYDGWIPCLIDFDQYQGTIQDVRRSTAKALAADLIDQVAPAWDADPDLN